MKQSLTLSNARVKLRQQHLWEWDTLSTTQKKVWGLIREETAEKLSSYSDDKVALADFKRRQSVRLIRIIGNQRGEREQMKMRHQQEFELLGQVL